MARAVIVLIRAYKRILSPLFAGSCRFHPSCASYMSDAVERHGAVRGVALGAWRLLRCQPFSRGGYDPVPEVWGRWNIRRADGPTGCGCSATPTSQDALPQESEHVTERAQGHREERTCQTRVHAKLAAGAEVR